MKRYINLFRIIAQRQCSSLVEIGVFDGIHAGQMIAVAQVQNDEVSYYGFDLFDDYSEGVSEYSKRPKPMDKILDRLVRTSANIALFRGDTRKTLPDNLDKLAGADFVFVDGGHAHDVVASDWSNIQQIMDSDTVVVFDDYYIDPPADVAEMGCNAVIDAIDQEEYDVQHLWPADSFRKKWSVLTIRMIMVMKRG